MHTVMRVYIEKKGEAGTEAQRLCKDLCENLGLTNLRGLRIALRYDVEGLSESEFQTVCRQILCEAPADKLYFEELPLGADEGAIAAEPLPGQYDQRADAAAQCIQLLTLKDRPTVQTAKVYILRGDLRQEERDAFCAYCVNPLDSRVGDGTKPASLLRKFPAPPDIPILDGFRGLDETGRQDFHNRLGLSMAPADLAFCQEYFRGEGRDPSLTEIRVLDTYWSDHCRHTTFNTVIEAYGVEDGRFKNAIENAILQYLSLRRQAGGEEKPMSLMDMATVNARVLRRLGKLDDLDVSEEVNACSIKVWAETDRGREPWLVMFKNETHNHPTEMEPYGGAATCIGGGIRDPLSGRAIIYQAMRITGCADPFTPVADTLPGKLPQRVITRQAAAGYSSYGNQVGVAAGLVDELYHPGYAAKRMEIGAVVGAAPEDHVRRGVPMPGDPVLLLGGRTGRDGLGGATSSSKVQSEQSLETAGAEVQKGDAATERKLLRLYRNPEFARLVKRCNDFGAGGVSVAIGELAPGLDIDLDRVPVKYDGLDGTELAISESQERMAVVIAPDALAKVLALAAAEDVEATEVAKVADHGRMKINWRGREIVNLSREFLDTAGVGQKTKIYIRQPEDSDYFMREGRRLRQKAAGFAEAWLDSMGELNICSKKGLIQRFDSTVGTGTLLAPLGGSRQETPAQAMAARLPVLSGESDTCTWMSYGFDPALSQWSPFHGSLYAVTQALTRLACAGGDPFQARMSFQEYFPSLGSDPAKWGLPMAAMLGAQTALTAFGVPAIGGKDSMSGSFHDLEVPPTLCAFALSAGSGETVLSPEWKKPGSLLAYFPVCADGDLCPDMEQVRRNFRFIAANRRHILSASAIGAGGLAAAAATASFGNGLGAELSVELTEAQMFEPAYGSVLLELAPDFPSAAITGEGGRILGKVLGEARIKLSFISASSGPAEGPVQPKQPEQPAQTAAEAGAAAVAAEAAGIAAGGVAAGAVEVDAGLLLRRWSETLEGIFPTKADSEGEAGVELDADPGFSGLSSASFSGGAALSPAHAATGWSADHGADRATASRLTGGPAGLAGHATDSSAGHAADNGAGHATGSPGSPALMKTKPRVLIPLFSGTTGEYDAARAFEKAGAAVEFAVLRSQTRKDAEESLNALAAAIAGAQIIMLPGGGGSIGDEADGSGKLAAIAFRNPRVREQTALLLSQRGGLMLGIGSGFQALLRLGFIPWGEIREMTEDSPALIANAVGRHQSLIVKTRIAGAVSPWLSGMHPGEIHHVPLSCGEGRLKAAPALLAALLARGQVVSQYCDGAGRPSMDIRDNPCGSALAIEGLCSPDGRILGKIGHSERADAGLLRNVPGNYDRRLFANGVNYFQ